MCILHMCLNLQQLRIWRLMIKYGPKIFGPNIAKLKRVIHFGCLIFKLHTLRACLFENGLWHTPQISLNWFIFVNSFKSFIRREIFWGVNQYLFGARESVWKYHWFDWNLGGGTLVLLNSTGLNHKIHLKHIDWFWSV